MADDIREVVADLGDVVDLERFTLLGGHGPRGSLDDDEAGAHEPFL